MSEDSQEDILHYILNEDRSPMELLHIKQLMLLPMRSRFIAMQTCLSFMIETGDAKNLWDNEDDVDAMYDHLSLHMDSIAEIDEETDKEYTDDLKKAIACVAEKMNSSVEDIYKLLNTKK